MAKFIGLDSGGRARFDGNGSVVVLDDAQPGMNVPPGSPPWSVDLADQFEKNGVSIIWSAAAGFPIAALQPTTPPVALAAQVPVVMASKIAAGVWFKAVGAAVPSLFASDDATNITAASALADKLAWHDGFPWPTLSGPPVPFATADVTRLAIQAGQYVLLCRLHAGILLAQIKAGATPDITLGWPSQGTPPA